MATTYGPYLEMARIQSEINRLFEKLAQLRRGGEPEGEFVPAADVYDRGDTVVLEMELPGVEARDLSLLVNGSDVIVRGVKPPSEVAPDGDRRSRERSFGAFERVLNLNLPVNTHKAGARLRDGLLRVVFPKVSNRRGEAVSIPLEED